MVRWVSGGWSRPWPDSRSVAAATVAVAGCGAADGFSTYVLVYLVGRSLLTPLATLLSAASQQASTMVSRNSMVCLAAFHYHTLFSENFVTSLSFSCAYESIYIHIYFFCLFTLSLHNYLNIDLQVITSNAPNFYTGKRISNLNP